jgi:hypothetical protein
MGKVIKVSGYGSGSEYSVQLNRTYYCLSEQIKVSS